MFKSHYWYFFLWSFEKNNHYYQTEGEKEEFFFHVYVSVYGIKQTKIVDLSPMNILQFCS